MCNWSEIEELKGKNNIRDMRAVKRSFMYGKIFHKRFLPCRRPQAHINIEDLDQNRFALLLNKQESFVRCCMCDLEDISQIFKPFVILFLTHC